MTSSVQSRTPSRKQKRKSNPAAPQTPPPVIDFPPEVEAAWLAAYEARCEAEDDGRHAIGSEQW